MGVLGKLGRLARNLRCAAGILQECQFDVLIQVTTLYTMSCDSCNFPSTSVAPKTQARGPVR